MLSKEQLQTIKEEVSLLLERLGLPGSLVVEQTEEAEGATVRVSATVQEPKLLIGEKGQTLFDVQHLLRLLLRKKVAEPFYLSLDVNEYRKNKEEYLRDLAKATADEVALLGKTKELQPMSSAERRLVHVALAERSDVVSESIGEGPDRRVAIRLKT